MYALLWANENEILTSANRDFIVYNKAFPIANTVVNSYKLQIKL